MNEQEALIHRLYMSLQQLDAEGMISCYHEDATFRDPLFMLKTKRDIAAMWTMLCSSAKELELTFEQVEANDETGSAHIKARYLFSQTNRIVNNRIDAQFRFKDGLIIEHNDSFNFWRWSRQALGFPGHLLGWSSFLQKKVQNEAGKNLKRFSRRV